MNMNCQTCPQPMLWADLGIQPKESKLKLSLETQQRGEVIIVYCQGRIVYRDEANALASVVSEILQDGGKVILDLSGVSTIDTAGIGELVMLYSLAQSKNAELKYASPRPFVSNLFDLFNVNSFFEIHPSVGEALAAFQSKAYAEC
jgi:anti-sigma B factor antagonist